MPSWPVSEPHFFLFIFLFLGYTLWHSRVISGTVLKNHPIGSGDHMGCGRWNSVWVHARQTPTHCVIAWASWPCFSSGYTIFPIASKELKDVRKAVETGQNQPLWNIDQLSELGIPVRGEEILLRGL